MENMGTPRKAIPLCWDDQVQQNETRVLTPRSGPSKEKRTIVSIT